MVLTGLSSNSLWSSADRISPVESFNGRTSYLVRPLRAGINHAPTHEQEVKYIPSQKKAGINPATTDEPRSKK